MRPQHRCRHGSQSRNGRTETIPCILEPYMGPGLRFLVCAGSNLPLENVPVCQATKLIRCALIPLRHRKFPRIYKARISGSQIQMEDAISKWTCKARILAQMATWIPSISLIGMRMRLPASGLRQRQAKLGDVLSSAVRKYEPTEHMAALGFNPNSTSCINEDFKYYILL